MFEHFCMVSNFHISVFVSSHMLPDRLSKGEEVSLFLMIQLLFAVRRLNYTNQVSTIS